MSSSGSKVLQSKKLKLSLSLLSRTCRRMVGVDEFLVQIGGGSLSPQVSLPPPDALPPFAALLDRIQQEILDTNARPSLSLSLSPTDMELELTWNGESRSRPGCCLNSTGRSSPSTSTLAATSSTRSSKRRRNWTSWRASWLERSVLSYQAGN